MKTDSVTVLAKKVSLEFDKLSNSMFQKYDLTTAQFRILKYLYAQPNNSTRQVDLEKYFSLTHPTTTGLLQALEKKGFVSREANPEDKRSRIVSLTAKAKEMQSELEPLADHLEEELTENLTGKEKKQLVVLLQKLLNIENN